MPFPYQVIDLTQSLSEDTCSWDTTCGFRHEMKGDDSASQADIKFRVQQIHMNAGIGTHIDAPAHCIDGGLTTDKLALSDLIRPCVCIDVSQNTGTDYIVDAETIARFEAAHGQIEQGSFVIVYTGWDRFWLQPSQYHNQLQFPSISEAAALHLLDREIAGLGIDTLSPDCPQSGFPVHKHLLGAGKYIVENVANAGSLPAMGSYTMALPLKAAGLTEAPIRLIGLIRHA